jgi:hypothetical protein
LWEAVLDVFGALKGEEVAVVGVGYSTRSVSGNLAAVASEASLVMVLARGWVGSIQMRWTGCTREFEAVKK